MSPKNNNANVCGDAIKKLRASLNMTQSQFGGFVNLDQKTISSYEVGMRKPCAQARESIYRFAKAKGRKIKLEHLCGMQ